MKYNSFLEAINKSKNIVIIQADNPDGDSLASSLALEEILSSLGKSVSMYCGVNIPTYLHYMSGWDRVNTYLEQNFDMSIIVDTSSITLLEILAKSGELNWLKTKPCYVIDHHTNASTIDFATESISFQAASTGAQIYEIFKELDLKISKIASEFIVYSILSDTLGLSTEAADSKTVHMIGELVDNGVSLAALDNNRKMYNKKSVEILKLKGRLLEMVDTNIDPRIATIDISFDIIEKYSNEYNPSMLVLDEMRMIEGVCVAIAFKTYPDGKITAKIRSNYGYKICDKLAEHFGGGGHGYAAGFKTKDSTSLFDVKAECIKVTNELLNEVNNHDNLKEQ